MLIAINYHYIRHDFKQAFPGIFGLTPTAFRSQLETLDKLGTFVSQEDVHHAITHQTSLPEKSILITFDDGLKEQYTNALPILKEMGIPAIFYVNTLPLTSQKVLTVHKIHLIRSTVSPAVLEEKIHAYIQLKKWEVPQKIVVKEGTYRYDNPANRRIKYLLNFMLDFEQRDELIDYLFKLFFKGKEESLSENLYMSASHIKALGEEGFLGCHSHAHFPLGLLKPAHAQREIEYSFQILQSITDKPIRSFSYPFGTEEAIQGSYQYLEPLECSFALTMNRGINFHFERPYNLLRFDTNDVPLGKSYKHAPHEMFVKLAENSSTLSS